MEVKGTLSLTANSDGANKCKVVLSSTDPSGAFTFQTHPKVCVYVCVCVFYVLFFALLCWVGDSRRCALNGCPARLCRKFLLAATVCGCVPLF